MPNRPLTGIPADKARSYASIEVLTSGLRESLGLSPADAFNALDFFHDQLSEIELTDHGKRVPIVEGVEACPQEGLTRWDASTGKLEVILSESTYQNLQVGHVRARSTVAHETGHAVLHTAQIIRLAGMGLVSQVAFHRDRVPHEAFLDTEWQANAFASSLLMPAEGIWSLDKKGDMNPSTIAKIYACLFSQRNTECKHSGGP